MPSVNKVFLLGNLGRDPDLRYTQGGAAVATLSVATSDTWIDKNGEPHDRTEWHRIVVWGRQAEAARQHLAKGRSVHVEGRLRTDEWTDNEGVKRRTTVIQADRVTFLGRGRDAGSRAEVEGSAADGSGAPEAA